MSGADISAFIKKQPIGAASLAIAVLCGVLIYFRSDAVAAQQQQFEEKDTEAQKVAQNARNTAGLAEQTAEMQQAAKQVEGRLIRASQLANNLQIFYRLETETGVKMQNPLQGTVPPPRPGAARTAYVGVPFSVTVQGTYPQVMTFIRRVETGPALCRFLTVSFSKVSGGSGAVAAGDTVSANLSFELLGTQ